MIRMAGVINKLKLEAEMLKEENSRCELVVLILPEVRTVLSSQILFNHRNSKDALLCHFKVPIRG